LLPGKIYLNVNTISGEEVAIKFEPVKVFKTFTGGIGVPFIRWFRAGCDYGIMVMDLLGPSLEDLFNFCRRKLRLKTVLLLVGQLVSLRVQCCFVFLFTAGFAALILIILSTFYRFSASSMSIREILSTGISSPTTYPWESSGVRDNKNLDLGLLRRVVGLYTSGMKLRVSNFSKTKCQYIALSRL
jgi:hypothetical protein